MKRPDEVTEYLRCGGPNCDNACSSQFDRLGVEDCKTWRVHGYVQQLEERMVHLESLNQQNLSVITMQERTRARLEEQISQLESLVPRWISVEERLPENEVAVIAYSKEDEHSWYAFRRGGLWWRPGDRISIKIFGNVTHWMPLPEPPKEE